MNRRRFIFNASKGLMVPFVAGPLVQAASIVPFNPQIRTVVGGSFSPPNISGLKEWLDGADATKIYTDSAMTTLVTTDADPVGGWKDKSSAANDFTQATAGTRAKYKTSIQNGHSIIRFEGANDLLKTMAALDAFTIFVVAKSDKTGSGGAYETLFTQGGTRGLFFYENNTDGTYTLDAEVGGSHNSGNTTVSTWVSFAYSQDASGNRQAWKNTSSFYTAASTHTPFTFDSLGGHGSEFLTGDIAEIIVYDTQLSSTDRGSVETYLNSKWTIY